MKSAACASPQELSSAIDRKHAEMCAASAEMLRLIADSDDRGLWEADGATSMSAWLAARYRIGKGTAREWVRMAHRARELPEVAGRYAKGLISGDQLRFLTRFVTPETDAYWASQARSYSPQELWVEARRHERETARQAEDAHRHRSLQMWWDTEKPNLYFSGMLAGDQAAAFETAVSRRADRIQRDPEAVSPGEARLADALTSLASETAGAVDPQLPSVVVHADASVLAGDEPPQGATRSETVGGHRLAAETVRRLACDARVDLVLESDGRPVGLGRRGRTVPAHIRRVIRHRDRGCRFPGCGRVRYTDAHHIVHWAAGGKTDFDNLVLLCGSHHRLIHEGGWKIGGTPGVDLQFYDPGGRPAFPPRPELPLAAGSGFP